MELLQCVIVALFVFWTGFIMGRIYDYLYTRMRADKEANELRQTEAKIAEENLDKELKIIKKNKQVFAITDRHFLIFTSRVFFF